MVALQRTRQPVARLLRLIEMLTRHQITAEIEAMRANGTLPSQALLNLAIHNDWLSIHLQNLIVNRGPGANAPRPLSPKHKQIIEQIEAGLSRDIRLGPED